MKKASKTNIDKLLKPPMDALKQTAAEAIRDAENSIRNVLQVRYDAGPECFPKGLPVPSLQMRRERHVPGLGFPCHSELVFPLREFDIRNEKNQKRVRRLRAGRCHRQGPGEEFFSTAWVNQLTLYRDGGHAQWHSVAFGNLLIYVLTPTSRIELIEEGERATAA